MSLSDTICKNAKPKEKEYKLTDGEGMYLLVKTNRTKSWRLKYRILGKEKLLTIGSYPQVTLLEARKKRTAARDLIAQGTDPSQQKKQEKRLLSLKEQNSFELVAREWHENNKHTWTDSHAHDILHRLEKDVFSAIGQRPIADISALELLDAIRKIEKRGAHELAHRSVQYCNKIFRYAILTARATHNPAADLKGALKPVIQGHYAAFESSALPGFLYCLEKNEARLFTLTRLAIKMLLLTFVRTGELGGKDLSKH